MGFDKAVRRAIQLNNNPNLVPGKFNLTHLKSVHAYIFQDREDPEIAPGVLRNEVKPGLYRTKERTLTEPSFTYMTFYSDMDQKALSTLETLFQGFEGINNKEFRDVIASSYSKIDYIHILTGLRKPS